MIVPDELVVALFGMGMGIQAWTLKKIADLDKKIAVISVQQALWLPINKKAVIKTVIENGNANED